MPRHGDDGCYTWGSLSAEQAEVLRPYVTGQVVTDLGSGADLVLAEQLLQLGAARVVAVDPLADFRHRYEPPGSVDPRIEPRSVEFVDFGDEVDVAFLSWPKMYGVEGLVEAVTRSPVVAYLGKNADGVSCGPVALFRHLAGRAVFAHAPDEVNTLIVYGGAVGGPRELLAEERSAIDRRTIHRRSRGG